MSSLFIGKGILKSKLASLCKEFRPAIIADSYVQTLYGSSLAKAINADLFEIPQGEAAKTRQVKEAIEDQLLQKGFGRDSLLIALGGGATLDLVGFIASTYLRGVALILAPTTLLAMVDAAIGGKTAINTPFGKNLIGTFYPPQAIIADVGTLQTLPEKELFNGFAEIWKIALVSDPSLWRLLQNPQTDLELLIQKSIQAKQKIVEQDPLEKGLRRILNFGHTIGHALETASSYVLSHGEAVAIGSLAETFLSMHLGYLSKQEFEQIISCYPKISFQFSKEKVLEALFFDKKKKGNEIRCVLIDQMGHAVSFDGEYCRAVSIKEIALALDWVQQVLSI